MAIIIKVAVPVTTALIRGKTIRLQKDLFGALDELKVGDKVQLEILRDGKKMTVEVTLADRATAAE